MASQGMEMAAGWSAKRGAAVSAAVVLLAAGSALAGPVPDYGFEWATVGNVGNAPIPAGMGGNDTAGRGAVDYTYRIAKTEITTADWVEFINGASPNFPEQPNNFWRPTFWGGFQNDDYEGPGFNWSFQPFLPESESLPVGGIRWRVAAMMCNWLHNGKVSEKWAFENGAYDISTFGETPDGGFTDQLTHHPDAKFWIPTYDEWLKAAFYDPNRNGDGEGGWWQYQYMSDEPPVPGMPGEPGAQTSAGIQEPPYDNAQWDIPVGSYPDAYSAYGLLDLSGGASEATEEAPIDLETGEPTWRFWQGSNASMEDSDTNEIVDRLSWDGWVTPPGDKHSRNGLRIASAVPGPGVFGIFVLGGLLSGAPRARRSAR